MRTNVFVYREEGGPLEWHEYFDDARLDAEILVKRHIDGRIGKTELARALGLNVKSINNMSIRGNLPKPAYYEGFPGETGWHNTGGSIDVARWIDAQLIEEVLERAQ